MSTQITKDAAGVKAIHTFINEYVNSKEGNDLVKNYLNDVDDETILAFLKGRKYIPDKAFENLKGLAELKLVKYPDMFPKELTPSLISLHQNPTATVLKNRDSQGRRIIVLDVAKWDTNHTSLLDMCTYGTFIMEKLITDEDCTKNGLIVIHDGAALSLQHIAEYSVKNFLRCINIFWYAYPVKYKAIYVVQTPYMLSCIVNLLKFFFPQKLKERMMIWSTEQGFKDLHKVLPPQILPKSLGGLLEFEDAIDPDMAVTF